MNRHLSKHLPKIASMDSETLRTLLSIDPVKMLVNLIYPNKKICNFFVGTSGQFEPFFIDLVAIF